MKLKLKGFEQLCKLGSVRNWTAETETERLRKPGKKGSFRKWTAETESETAEAETGKFEQLLAEQYLNLTVEMGAERQKLKLRVLDSCISGAISENNRIKWNWTAELMRILKLLCIRTVSETKYQKLKLTSKLKLKDPDNCVSSMVFETELQRQTETVESVIEKSGW